ncbi:hypothetical protein CISIN_1g035045mg [Citrus sinensis]|uniref:Uncharacterized protein n=1 Tax=Citrus sinensis TaxID=2711 RepID=A0A067GKM4_CITSI|nr:hypothetical protein CISIN_1g035045mg [Citrus sinensis]
MLYFETGLVLSCNFASSRNLSPHVSHNFVQNSVEVLSWDWVGFSKNVELQTTDTLLRWTDSFSCKSAANRSHVFM